MIRTILGRALLALLLALQPALAMAQSPSPAPAAGEVLQSRFAPPLDQPLRYRMTLTDLEDGKPVTKVMVQEITFTRAGEGYVMALRWLSLTAAGQTLDLTKDKLPLPPEIALMIRPVALELAPNGQILRVREWDRYRRELIEAAPALAEMLSSNAEERAEMAGFLAGFFTQFTSVPAERAHWLVVYGWPEVLMLASTSGPAGAAQSSRHLVQSVYSPDPLTYEFQTRLSRTADGKGLRIVSSGSPDAAGAKAITTKLVATVMSSLPNSTDADKRMVEEMFANPKLSTQLDVDLDLQTGLPRKAKLVLLEKFDRLDQSSTILLEAL